jgi:hypothetical protein
MDKQIEDKLERAEAWGLALDYKVDLHLKWIKTQKMGKWQEADVLEKMYKAAERVEEKLALSI